MRRILFGLALFGLIGSLVVPSEASAAPIRSARSTQVAGKTHSTKRVHKVRHVNKAHPTTKAPAVKKTPAVNKARSVDKAHSGRTAHNVSSGPMRRYFGTRLYYSNAFRGMIPGTGYGGFRRPAFGNRGY